MRVNTVIYILLFLQWFVRYPVRKNRQERFFISDSELADNLKEMGFNPSSVAYIKNLFLELITLQS